MKATLEICIGEISDSETKLACLSTLYDIFAEFREKTSDCKIFGFENLKPFLSKFGNLPE